MAAFLFAVRTECHFVVIINQPVVGARGAYRTRPRTFIIALDVLAVSNLTAIQIMIKEAGKTSAPTGGRSAQILGLDRVDLHHLLKAEIHRGPGCV